MSPRSGLTAVSVASLILAGPSLAQGVEEEMVDEIIVEGRAQKLYRGRLRESARYHAKG